MLNLLRSCYRSLSYFSLYTANFTSYRFITSAHLCLYPDILESSRLISSPFALSSSSLKAWYYWILFCLNASRLMVAVWSCCAKCVLAACSSWFSLWAFSMIFKARLYLLSSSCIYLPWSIIYPCMYWPLLVDFRHTDISSCSWVLAGPSRAAAHRPGFEKTRSPSRYCSAFWIWLEEGYLRR